jgi:hypothetical protein
MIYQQLFDRVKEPKVVRAALIGCGDFGAAVITQGRLVPRLELRAICDINIEAVRKALRRAGVEDTDTVVCDTAGQALRAHEAGKWVIVEDAMNLMGLPVHVIVTAMMMPEAGARRAYEGIRHGKHVVMVDKETDSVCGPLLKHLAVRSGEFGAGSNDVRDNWITNEDPGFEDAGSLNLRLKPDSVVYRMIPGFEPIPFEQIGLYTDEYRKVLPAKHGVPGTPVKG